MLLRAHEHAVNARAVLAPAVGCFDSNFFLGASWTLAVDMRAVRRAARVSHASSACIDYSRFNFSEIIENDLHLQMLDIQIECLLRQFGRFRDVSEIAFELLTSNYRHKLEKFPLTMTDIATSDF